jgi:hypothetical protein
MTRRVRRTAILALLAAALGCGLPGSALASRDAEVSIMDDQLLLGGSPQLVADSMAGFRAMGIDRVRVSAFWATHAPNASGRRKPAGFAASNHADPRYNWSLLDRVVGAAAANGLQLMISITTPAPVWATERPGRRSQLWKPKAGEFADFAQAVASRYGAFTGQYGVMNEPNQGGWLQPQSERGRLSSPHTYRQMAVAAYPRIKAADADSNVLMFELAPSGRDARGTTRPVRPLEFLRAAGCRDDRFRRIRTGSCRRFRPIPADAVGHHPYAFFSRPDERSRERDDATLGDGLRLARTLDRLVRAGAIRPSGGRKLDVYYTEYGFQTDPPDPFAGIPLARQDSYLQRAAYVAWRTPRVKAINQFRLTDGKINRRTGYQGFNEFQSGLMFDDFRPKPAFRSFPHPFVSLGGGRLWGQARPGAAHSIEVDYRSGSAGAFATVARTRSDGRGYFTVSGQSRSGEYRFRYEGGTSEVLTVR